MSSSTKRNSIFNLREKYVDADILEKTIDMIYASGIPYEELKREKEKEKKRTYNNKKQYGRCNKYGYLVRELSLAEIKTLCEA